jgi:hypothetical protein
MNMPAGFAIADYPGKAVKTTVDAWLQVRYAD